MKYVPWGLIDDMIQIMLPRRQAIIWINADLIHWRIYAALGGDLNTGFALHLHERYNVQDLYTVFTSCVKLWFRTN